MIARADDFTLDQPSAVQSVNQDTLFTKFTSAARLLGDATITRILNLYYAAEAPSTPLWAKSVILSALAYFIMPADAIPDFIPVAGYSDDLVTLSAALATVSFYVTPEIQARSRETLQAWRRAWWGE